MARLKISAIEVDLPIYHGTSEQVLHQGVGHLEGTALPAGGETTYSVLTAHRGLATAELSRTSTVLTSTHFTIEVIVCRVVDTRVVEPQGTESLVPVVGRDLVTLATCTPLGVNSRRILVTGERVAPTPSRRSTAPAPKSTPFRGGASPSAARCWPRWRTFGGPSFRRVPGD